MESVDTIPMEMVKASGDSDAIGLPIEKILDTPIAPQAPLDTPQVVQMKVEMDPSVSPNKFKDITNETHDIANHGDTAVKEEKNQNEDSKELEDLGPKTAVKEEEKKAILETPQPIIQANASIEKTPITASSRRVQPLDSLNPYKEFWTVCAKVTNKSALRSFSSNKSNGGGSVFDIELMDTKGTQIRATLWREVADKYYETLEVGKVYYISNGKVKPANRKYSSVNNQYEMHFNERSEIEAVDLESVATKLNFKVSYDFVKIKNLASFVGRKRMLDVVGVATNVGQLGSVKRKSDGSELLRRDVTIVDESSLTVTVTLWDKLAEIQGQALESSASPQIVVLRGVRVTDFNGVSVSTVSRTEMIIEPDDVTEVSKLRQWFDEKGKDMETKAAGEGLASANKSTKVGGAIQRKELKDIPNVDDLTSSTTYVNNIVATVTKVFTNSMYYRACPEKDNNKKVIDNGDGEWICEATDTKYSSFKWVYMINAMLSDATHEVKVNMYAKEGELLFGMTAGELDAQRQTMDDKRFEQLVESLACWKNFSLSCAVRKNEYKGTTSRRTTIQNMRNIDYVTETRRLLDEIKRLEE